MSTDKVIQLPDSMQRQWRVFEAKLRRACSAAGVDPTVADVALERIKPLEILIREIQLINLRGEGG